ncbi:ergothioneine biosynthesis PLP-dependent enzyme EgtE [Mycobacterium sp. MYCO198283]|uniref:ergothioneine biosynthesis PLP-dependent enzyme EgtE n=1 Tax=Mycobacterium sp. MYCO198283 TaxID=2883505 RepID=UPI001E30FB3C|nr:ergothioneine biosynthesis PLP-dependent enzyme EgtE [Mycobacterium sp. MYCO198283]MCG5432863.1 ergothioneine biosynthesis PLP-dependent enzyme EgtE [Mycobacterium sp. MYCO198283]
MTDSLAARWRAARPPVAGIHVDNAACSRQSVAAMAAADRHAHHEAEVGGYVAGEAAAPVLDAGRAAVAALVGMAADEVVYTTGSGDALDVLLGAWPRGRRVFACARGEYGPNLAVVAAHGFDVRLLPTDVAGRLDVAAAAADLAAEPPDLVQLTAVGSHRGLLQPAAAVGEVCRELGVPYVVDAAQALGHTDCDVGADAVYSSSRKWLAGPRGVGVLAIRRPLADRLTPRLRPAGDAPVHRRLEAGEANVAARIGFAVAVGEHLAAGPQQVQARLAEVGRLTREAVAGVAGWRVVEPVDEPTAITTLEPTDGADPAVVRSRLIAERGVLTTYAGIERAPHELRTPVLRLSPHVDVTAEELAAVAAALYPLGR